MPNVIDIHAHPAFFEPICTDAHTVERRRQAMGLYKSNVALLKQIVNKMNVAQIEKMVLLPLDLTTQEGFEVVSNSDIERLVALLPERFIGFASVDPFRKDALEILEYAFTSLKLAGLKLHPSRQRFYPADPALTPIYEMCIR